MKTSYLISLLVMILLALISIFIVLFYETRILTTLKRIVHPKTSMQSEVSTENNENEQKIENDAQPRKVFYKDLTLSNYGRLNVSWLLLYRILILFYLVISIIFEVLKHGIDALQYFTVWNIILLGFYFLMATLFSFSAIIPLRLKNSFLFRIFISGQLSTENESLDRFVILKNEASLLGYVMQIVYQVSFSMSIFVDVIVWAILFPLSKKNNNTEESLFDFASISAHVINFFCCFGEFILNSLPFHFFRFAYVLLWCDLYLAFQWVYHDHYHNKWAYPFLNHDKSKAPLWYILLTIFAFISFLIWYLFHYCKWRILIHKRETNVV